MSRWILVAMVGCGGLACSADAADCPPCASAGQPALSVPAGSSSASAASADPEMTFRKEGERVRTLRLADLVREIPSETIKQFDPYYAREKTYRAIPLASVVELGFKGEKDLPTREYVLRALDGYTVPLTGSKVFEKGAYLAFEDVEKPGWEPIGERRANPAPYYVIWAGKDQLDLETHPRPYQLASIEIARFEDVFPRTVPSGLEASHPAHRGFAIFKQQCIHCHAVNRQGGRVGPEMNLPKSIVEYRPAEQIKAYIKNPLEFRYSTMPPHPTLTDGDLEGIVAYFTAMKDRKQDDPKTP